MVRKHPGPVEGQRRTRYDPPDVDEAVEAARGLTNEIDIQIEIAAQLIGLSEDEIRPVVLKAAARAVSVRPEAAHTRHVLREGGLAGRRGFRPRAR